MWTDLYLAVNALFAKCDQCDHSHVWQLGLVFGNNHLLGVLKRSKYRNVASQEEHNLGWSSAVEDNGLGLDFLVHVEQIHPVHLVLEVLSKSTLRSWGPPCLACPWGRPPPACQSRQWGSSHTHPDQSPACNTSQLITVCTPPLFPLEIKLKGNNQKCSFQEYRTNWYNLRSGIRM